MSTKLILVVKDSGSGYMKADYWANQLAERVEDFYNEEFDREVCDLKYKYSLGQKGMEKIIDQYGTDIIVACEWVSRLTNKLEEFPYFDSLVKKGVEFYFGYGSREFVWNKKEGEEQFKLLLGWAAETSKNKSILAKDSMKSTKAGDK